MSSSQKIAKKSANVFSIWSKWPFEISKISKIAKILSGNRKKILDSGQKKNCGFRVPTKFIYKNFCYPPDRTAAPSPLSKDNKII